MLSRGAVTAEDMTMNLATYCIEALRGQGRAFVLYVTSRVERDVRTVCVSVAAAC